MPVNMKEVIAKTFFQMAGHRDIDRITVKDLVEECKISRQTFYYHFQDLMEVIEWSVNQALEKTLEQSLKAETPEEALQIFIATGRDKKELLLRLLRSQKREQIERTMVQAMEAYLRTMFQQQAADLDLSMSDLEVTLHYCTYGIVGVLLESSAKKSLDEKKLARQMYLLLTGQMLRFEER